MGNIVHYIKSYLEDRRNRVTLDEYQTSWVLHSAGLPQGGPMMPILWTMYLNDYKVDDPYYIKLVAFADDLTMYTLPQRNINGMQVKKLQNEINLFFCWTLRWKLVVNASKCNTLTIMKT